MYDSLQFLRKKCSLKLKRAVKNKKTKGGCVFNIIIIYEN